MRTSRVLVVLLFFLASFCSQSRQTARLKDFSAVGKAEAQEYEPNYFDSLNNGREIRLSAGDFQASSRPASSTAETEYQVQFFAAVQRDVAEKEKARIEETLEIPVTLVYEAPYYKLRAGHFKTRAQAEDFKLKMFEIGHRNAWVVQKSK